MVKLDKSQYTKSQWKVIKEQRKKTKQQERESREAAKKQVQVNTISDNLENQNKYKKEESKGKIAFVLGNGTSRANIPLSPLQQMGRVYGCNALYRHYKPDYLVAVDTKMILEINKTGYQNNNEVWTNPNKVYHKMTNFNYFQPSKGWSSGPTALWLATQHGYQHIYILGFDYQGLDSGKKFNNIYADTRNYKKSTEGATFYGNWMRQTKSVVQEFKDIKFTRVIAPDNYVPEELNKFVNVEHISVETFKKIYNLA
jgi:uncharacterized Rossmann fold enzyme